MPNRAVPKSKKNDLIDEVNSLIRNDDRNAFAIKKIKFEAEKLKKINTADAFTILGMVACLEQDIEAMHSHHKNALRYSDEDWCRLQYAVSASNTGDLQTAYDQAFIVHEKNPENKGALDMIIAALGIIGDEDKFRIFTEKWKQLTGKDHPTTVFPEDDDTHLSKLFQVCEEIISTRPDLVSPLDPKLVNAVDKLVEGVD